MQLLKIKNISFLGEQEAIDFRVDHPNHNFYANGLVTSNSHATAYSKLTALTVYLKWKYPSLFFLECIKKAHKDQDPYNTMGEILPELPYFGIKLLPPDLTKSELDFKLEGNNIRYGLSCIKYMGNSVNKLQGFIDKEKTNKFQIFQAAKEVKMDVRMLSALIQAGLFTSISEDRPRMVLEAQIWSKLSDREKNYCLINGDQYKFDLINALKEYTSWNDGKVFKESRLETIRKHTKPYLEIYHHNTNQHELACYIYERALLGYSYNHSLRSLFLDQDSELKTCGQVQNEVDHNGYVSIIGHVIEVKKGKNKKDKEQLTIWVRDETGTQVVMMNGEELERYLRFAEMPKKDDIVLVNGNKWNDLVFAKRLKIQDFKVYFQVGELKNKEEANENAE